MKPVLLSLGGGGLAEAAILAGTLRLLARGGLGPARRADAACPRALQACSRLVVAGSLPSEEAMLRAARQVLLAKQAGVPAALAAVCLPPAEAMATPAHPRHDLAMAALRVLALADGLCAGDAATARVLSSCRGGRVECTAPLELLAEIPARRASDAFVIGVDGGALAQAGPALAAALDSLAPAWSARLRIVGARAPWRWRRGAWPVPYRALASCDLFVAAADTPLLHVAAAHGAVPVALVAAGARCTLHDRLGLDHLVQARTATRADWAATLERARAVDAAGLRARMATLQVVAWRTLGVLAEATRSTPLPPAAVDTELLAGLAAAGALPAQSGATLAVDTHAAADEPAIPAATAAAPGS